MRPAVQVAGKVGWEDDMAEVTSKLVEAMLTTVATGAKPAPTDQEDTVDNMPIEFDGVLGAEVVAITSTLVILGGTINKQGR